MEYPEIKEPHKVLLKKGEFIDDKRGGRDIPYKVYHPVDHDLEKLPVIIWSHGFGGNANGASFLSRFLAGQGYVLFHITHRGTDSSLWEGKEGHPWEVLRKVKITRDTTLNRFRDVPFVLDQLPRWAGEHSDVGAFMDLENLGMSGHSFGAMTTQVMAGQMFPVEDGTLSSMIEPRFKAGILYSPVPIRHLVGDESDEELYGPITLPLLHMTGTDDQSPLEDFGYEHRLSVYNNSSAKQKYALIKKDGDHMVYNGTRGGLGDSDLRALHEEMIQHVALAYWDMMLKNNEAAKDWLIEGGVSAYLGENGEFRIS